MIVDLFSSRNVSSCEVLNITVDNKTESSYVKRCCNVESTGVSTCLLALQYLMWYTVIRQLVCNNEIVRHVEC